MAEMKRNLCLSHFLYTHKLSGGDPSYKPYPQIHPYQPITKFFNQERKKENES